MNKHESMKINGEAYKVGFSFLAVKLFEEMTGRSLTTIASTYDNIMFFYCTLQALNETFSMSLDEFSNYLDSEPELFIQFIEISNKPTSTPKPKPKPAKKKPAKNQLSIVWMLSPLLVLSPVLIPIIFICIWIWTSLRLLVMFIAKAGRGLATKSWRRAEN